MVQIAVMLDAVLVVRKTGLRSGERIQIQRVTYGLPRKLYTAKAYIYVYYFIAEVSNLSLSGNDIFQVISSSKVLFC
jgi:hypothetical protein